MCPRLGIFEKVVIFLVSKGPFLSPLCISYLLPLGGSRNLLTGAMWTNSKIWMLLKPMLASVLRAGAHFHGITNSLGKWSILNGRAWGCTLQAGTGPWALGAWSNLSISEPRSRVWEIPKTVAGSPQCGLEVACLLPVSWGPWTWCREETRGAF